VALAGAAAGALAATAMVVAARGPDGAEAGTVPGPTATVTARDLTTTLTETAVLERTATRTVSHASAAVSGGDAGSGGATPPGGGTSGDDGTADDTTADDSDVGADTDADTGNADDPEDDQVLTGILGIGDPVSAGTVLYTVDDEPVVALTGAVPLWRNLAEGTADGEDVRQVETNLAALGYGDGLTVDGEYTAATAAAVEAWESDLGRAAPDGTVEVGEAVFLDGDGLVLGQESAVGDALDPGAAVLEVGSVQQVLTGDVDAEDADVWAAGTDVSLTWADGTGTTGTVLGTGRDVVDGEVALTVAVDDADSARVTGAEATLSVVADQRAGVLAVPVGAVAEGPSGEPAVLVVPDEGAGGEGTDAWRTVELGSVADGWVEVTAGLDEGEVVRLPG
jgi:hypothetical protein